MRMANSNLIVEDSRGPDRYVGFFEQTEGTDEGTPPGGYLYISDRQNNEIIAAVEINRITLDLEPANIRIFWSDDGQKCGVAVWGRMRGVMNIATGEQVHTELKNRQSQAITDPRWLEGFDRYLDHHLFIRARQQFWKTEAQYEAPHTQPRLESETPIETNFVLYEKRPDELFAVFEDDGASGYLYLYDARQQQIVEHVHNYDRSEKLSVREQDVEIAWSQDGLKCGVLIWNKMRGIIDRQKPLPGRVWMEDQDSPGIADNDWLRGFE